MEIELSSETLWQLAITLGLGLLVGLERERAGKEVGLRTFSLSALLGFLSWKMGPVFAVGTLAFIAVMVVVINVSALQKGTGVEATTSVCLFLITIVGMLVALEALFLAIAIVIFTLLLLSWEVGDARLYDAPPAKRVARCDHPRPAQLCDLACAAQGAFDPWGLFAPRQVWWMVVLISAIGFANYILLKLYGTKGITYTGFLGGLVNSTATAAELSGKLRSSPAGLVETTFRGLDVGQDGGFFAKRDHLGALCPFGIARRFVACGHDASRHNLARVRGRSRETESPPELKLESPFSLRSALTFGVFFAGITVIGGISQQVAGNLGFYAVSFAGGIVSSSSTAATAAHLVSQGLISPAVAGSPASS